MLRRASARAASVLRVAVARADADGSRTDLHLAAWRAVEELRLGRWREAARQVEPLKRGGAAWRKARDLVVLFSALLGSAEALEEGGEAAALRVLDRLLDELQGRKQR